MVWTIVKKEFLESLLDRKFIVSTILASLICWTSTCVLTMNYNDAVHDYYKRANFKDQMLDGYFNVSSAGGLIVRPLKPPSILSSLARGVLGDWIATGSIDENPVPTLFPFMDILFVIGIIMSIASLTLSYDRISGEKETGTLKMLMLGDYPRVKILLGKWMGGILSVLLILTLALSGSVLIALTLSQSHWTSIEWTAIAFLFILSILYCISFFSLGLYVSAKTKSPSDSIILSLVFWILFTLILPTVPPYIAEMVYPKPSSARIQYETLFRFEQERKTAIKSIEAPYLARGMQSPAIEETLKTEIEKINSDYSKSRHTIEQSVLTQAATYELITALIHFLSPFSSYALAGAELTATGVLNQVYFTSKASDYENSFFSDYLPRKVAEAKRFDPHYTGETVLDIRDRPRFEYVEEGIALRIGASAPHSMFILIYAVFFLVMAMKAFTRYDVR